MSKPINTDPLLMAAVIALIYLLLFLLSTQTR